MRLVNLARLWFRDHCPQWTYKVQKKFFNFFNHSLINTTKPSSQVTSLPFFSN